MSAARDARRARFGPLEGDRIRLGDTDLWVRVGEDRQAAGDEPYWGYAKNLRRGWSRAGAPDPRSSTSSSRARSSSTRSIGVVKADIGIKDGRIVGHRSGGQP